MLKRGTLVVYLILTGIIALAVYGTIKRIRYGSSCCGTHEPAHKRVKVADKNKDLFHDHSSVNKYSNEHTLTAILYACSKAESTDSLTRKGAHLKSKCAPSKEL